MSKASLMSKSMMSGGGLADDLLKGANALQSAGDNEVVPKVEIPDNTITEQIIPDKGLTNAIIEQARSIDGSSFSVSAILNVIIAYMAKVLFVGFEIENKMLHNGLLALLWLGIAGSLFGIATAISNTNITFIMYCSAIWIIALAILFVILQPYRANSVV
uniref:Uncharacterized protein n=1 Tax=viral metagenome TaxID=1070528 RepID=A0A6C0B5U7_9ZZZZ